MKKVILYIHGQGGNYHEATQYIKNCPEYDVVGIDYQVDMPWIVKPLIKKAYEDIAQIYEEIIIVANSIGAYFTMDSLPDKNIKKALFISPILNMEKLITDMMVWSNISEKELQEKKEIATNFGETLSWQYLCYVREHPVYWPISTAILYGTQDHMTSWQTVVSFVKNHGADLTVMDNGEHWFHTKEQILFVNKWIKKTIEEMNE